MIPCPSPQLLPNLLHPVSQIETSHFHNPLPFQLCCSYSFSEEMGPLTSHTPYALSFPPSLQWSKLLHCCHKSVVRKTLPAVPVDTFCRTLIIFFLTVCSLSLYAHLSLTLQSAPQACWLNCRVSAKFLCFSIPWKGLGSTTTQSGCFKNEKQCSMFYRMLQITSQMFQICRNLLLCNNNFSADMSSVVIRKLLMWISVC